MISKRLIRGGVICICLTALVVEAQSPASDKGGHLGAEVQAKDAGLRDAYNMTQDYGVLVIRVHPNTGAASAGIQGGDVILLFDSKEIRSPKQLAQIVHSRAPGEVVYAIVLRGDKLTPLPVTLGDATQIPAPAAIATNAR